MVHFLTGLEPVCVSLTFTHAPLCDIVLVLCAHELLLHNCGSMPDLSNFKGGSWLAGASLSVFTELCVLGLFEAGLH